MPSSGTSSTAYGVGVIFIGFDTTSDWRPCNITCPAFGLASFLRQGLWVVSKVASSFQARQSCAHRWSCSVGLVVKPSIAITSPCLASLLRSQFTHVLHHCSDHSLCFGFSPIPCSPGSQLNLLVSFSVTGCVLRRRSSSTSTLLDLCRLSRDSMFHWDTFLEGRVFEPFTFFARVHRVFCIASGGENSMTLATVLRICRGSGSEFTYHTIVRSMSVLTVTLSTAQALKHGA